MKALPPLPCTYCRQPAQWTVTGDGGPRGGYWSAGACQTHRARAEARAAQAGPVTTTPVEGAPEPDQPDLFTTTEEGTPE